MQNEAKPEVFVRMIWFAILMSLFIYGIIAVVAVPQQDIRPLADLVREPLVLMLYVAGFAIFVAAFVVPTVLLRTGRAAKAKPAPTTELTVSPETRQLLIVRFALLEASAILGLVAAFMMGEWLLYLPLGVLALAGFLLSWPGDDLLRRLGDPTR